MPPADSNSSPIERLLAALDRLDVDAAMDLVAPECRLLTVDGRRAEGADAVREALTAALEALRSASHRITRQWHQDEVWIAEMEATYVLQDWLEMVDLPRAVVLYDGPAGATQLHFYGAQERPLSDHPTGEEGTWLRERWIPPL